jgi:nitroreductase
MTADYDPRVAPWQVGEDDIPSAGAFEDTARFLLRFAILAPSGHNTQPWKFAVRAPDVLVFADPARRLPVADPDDRELTISLGAAAMNLRAAAARAGFVANVLAEGAVDGGPVARIRLSKAGDPDPALAALFPAITARRTWRLAMEDRPLADAAAAALAGLTALGGASLQVVADEAQRAALEALIHEGDLARMSDKAFRRELAHWMRPAHSHADDGLAGDALGLSSFASILAAWSTKTFDMGKSMAAKDVALSRESAALVVVLSADEPAALLDAGQLMERYVLTAALHGVACSFFNLPVEAPEIRGKIGKLLGAAQLPQVLFRLGYPTGADLKPSARRPLEDVLMD